MKKTLILIAILLSLQTAFAQQSKPVYVKVYLQKGGDLSKNKVRINLKFIKRKAEADAPLKSALEWLFKPQLTTAEERQKFYEIDFGMKFEGVTLKNGTATVRFSETSIANYISSSSGIFAAAVIKTVKQFPEVKRVKICSVGETSFDLESDRQLFYPCK